MREFGNRRLVPLVMLVVLSLIIPFSSLIAQTKFPTRTINFYVAAPPGIL